MHVDIAFAQEGNAATKQTLALQSAAQAASLLVQGLPAEQRSMLRLLFNHPFPPPFRPQAWKLFLSDPTTRFKYESKCVTNRIGTISVLDAQFTVKCQAVLDAFPSVPPSRNIHMAMKTALSYIHTITPQAFSTLGEAYFSLVLPLLLVWPDADASSLVEAYATLLAIVPRPHFVDEAFVSRVVDLLNTVDASYATSLVTLFPSETTPMASWTELLEAYVERLFVGYTSPDTLLFIWDQLFLVGHGRMLPELCAAFLSILQYEVDTTMGSKHIVRRRGGHHHIAGKPAVNSIAATFATGHDDRWGIQEWVDQYASASIRQDLQLESLSMAFHTNYSIEPTSIVIPPQTPPKAPGMMTLTPTTDQSVAPVSARLALLSPSSSPRHVAPLLESLVVENAFNPFVNELHSSLTALFIGSPEDGVHIQHQRDALETAAAAAANGFARHVDTFRESIASCMKNVFLQSNDNAPQINVTASSEEAFQADLVLQSQKAVFGRTYTSKEVRGLTGKAKAAYDKKYPKIVRNSV
ncbi:hypothetical protein AaE_011125 [Aphanomyces astaci]|uniref:Uncharacterized protein n=1 Tax=Aphanomyces astaci TaxID=112090 RepID=A0A6A4ZV15_APHAT|nr:hypothetical protein AaE_011125 [Aphanomyces astaci]